MSVFTRRLRQLVRAGSVVTILGAGLLPVAASPAAASSTAVGYVRLAHLSPDTPDVDVYLSSLSSPGNPQVFQENSYQDRANEDTIAWAALSTKLITTCVN